MFRSFTLGALLCGFTGIGCTEAHFAPVRTARLPPAPEPVVRHTGRLLLELTPGVAKIQCLTPKHSRELCFDAIDTALATSIERALWPSFPRVEPLGFGDAPEPGDYVLRVELALEPLPPSSGGPGWAARAKGRWQLIRDGQVLAAENVESRSRADFAYGRMLGVGAGEVVDAIAMHVAMTIGRVPEARPDRPSPLPEVVAQPPESARQASR
jgi:hypothetical protein